MSTRWMIVQEDSGLRIAEVGVPEKAAHSSKTLGSDTTFPSYEDAKQHAIAQLREQIDRLESQAAYPEPPLQAWQKSGYVVTAKSKERARELVDESEYGFTKHWHACAGVWWFHLAYEEGIWAAESGAVQDGDDTFMRVLSQDEADEIAEMHIAPFRVMTEHELMSLVEVSETREGETSNGVLYSVTIEVAKCDDFICDLLVVVSVKDNVGWRVFRATHGRHLSPPTPVAQ